MQPRVPSARVRGLSSVFLAVVFSTLAGAATAFTPGKTYDRSNWEEIRDLLPAPVLDWVKKGEWILPTGQFDFEWELNERFRQASLANAGKYAMSEEGALIEVGTGKVVRFLYGYPFPEIDPKHPDAAEWIMENNSARRFLLVGETAFSSIKWVNQKAREREVAAGMNLLFYLQRPEGPIPNPRNLQQQHMTYVIEPFDLRGTVQMSWIYNDSRLDTLFAYIPMLRRVRRISSAARSDPFLGSDLCTDDANLWAGKTAHMNWRFLGQKTILAPFSTLEKTVNPENPDGSCDVTLRYVRKGYEVPGWQGAAWAPVDTVFAPRPCWMVEALAKDPFYNYGKQIFYLDKTHYIPYYKVIHDRSGAYWKTVVMVHSYQMSASGKDMTGVANLYLAIDDKEAHATDADIVGYKGKGLTTYLPLDRLGPQDFTTSRMVQLSK